MFRMSKKLVGAEEFHQRVRLEAYQIWQSSERRGRDHDWSDATAVLYRELGSFLPSEEIRKKAKELWLSRKDDQALEDWLEAERRVLESFQVAA